MNTFIRTQITPTMPRSPKAADVIGIDILDEMLSVEFSNEIEPRNYPKRTFFCWYEDNYCTEPYSSTNITGFNLPAGGYWEHSGNYNPSESVEDNFLDNHPKDQLAIVKEYLVCKGLAVGGVRC